MPSTPSLPEARPVSIRCEADYYGASHMIARELGLHEPPLSSSSWVHGCDMFPVPREVFSPVKSDPEATHLVANHATQEWWKDNGFKRAVAVGCPFAYARPSGLARIPGSALAMPSHGLPGSGRDAEQTEAWFSAVARLREDYSLVRVCIHADDLDALRPHLEKHSLDWFVGASLNAVSLPRMRAIFDSFELMVTDVQGSHIPYAAWCGCRVSLMEPLYVRKWEHFENHPHMKKYPELRKNIAFHEPDFIRQRLPFLFPPTLNEASCPREWAEELMGLGCMKEPWELARLLGWKADDPAFLGWPYEQTATLLGACNPDPEVVWLREKRDADDVNMKEMKAQYKQALKEAGQMEKQISRQQPFLNSFSARLGRSLYSIERRLRGISPGEK